jgi:hypothetical protein
VNKNDPSDSKPLEPETGAQQPPNDIPTENRKPVPDGEAIAEVGDAVGGPA